MYWWWFCFKYGEQWGRGCVIPRGRYYPKGLIPCIFQITDNNELVIILGEVWRITRKWLCHTKGQLCPKRGDLLIFSMTKANAYMIIFCEGWIETRTWLYRGDAAYHKGVLLEKHTSIFLQFDVDYLIRSFFNTIVIENM